MSNVNNISVTVSAPNVGLLASELLTLGNQLTTPVPTGTPPMTTKPAARKAAKPPVEVEEGTFEEETTFGEGDDYETDDVEGPSLDDVKDALRAFAARAVSNREKAKAILKKYNAKSVNDLESADYAAVIAATKRK